MLLGIDVGGTFTDAVIIDGTEILAQAKKTTTHENVLDGILAALDGVLQEQFSKAIERVVISSTIVTNALTENKIEPVFLAVMTGPGANAIGKFPVEPYYVEGYVDHRGKITAKPDWTKVEAELGKNRHGICAASGKFAVREPQQEALLGDRLLHCGYEKVFLGSELSGELNFVRRTNSAYFAAAVYKVFLDFCQKVVQALVQRGIVAPVHILKADGGTLPIEVALEQPIEAVFTGPAASVLGVEAIAAPEVNSISLDVGGTTTDIAFWEQGLPLMARKGADINGYHTAVRSFHMRSIGIGGDSCVKRNSDGSYKVGPERQGPAAAVGGEAVTLSDALITAGYISFGNVERAKAAVAALGGNPVAEANMIVQAAVRSITSTIEEMLAEWAKQPVYTVDDVIKGTEFVPEQLIGVGGGSLGLVKAVGEVLELPVNIPKGAMVANAIGAALARPTLSAGLRADTTEGFYLIPEEGRKQRLPQDFDKQTAMNILSKWLENKTREWQLPDQNTELISYEHFATVHSYWDSGEIYSLRMQLKPGILNKVEGKEVAF